jgi:NAD(P)-dependent dehydrogenase (short-subunit alcohol dehydrogenase family)
MVLLPPKTPSVCSANESLVLVNNAGVAFPPGENAGDEVDDISRMRERYNKTFNTNITSVATVTAAFLPLLRKGRLGKYGKVVNIGSGRGSLGRSLEVPRTMVKEYRCVFHLLFSHFPLCKH